MPSRRLEKVSSHIRTILSRLIQSRLSDPRIQGMVSITRVEPSPDLRHARIYLSVLGVNESQQQLSLQGIQHAGSFLRSQLANELEMKTCPKLQFLLDDSIKKEIQMMQIFEQISQERQLDEDTPNPAENIGDLGAEHEK